MGPATHFVARRISRYKRTVILVNAQGTRDTAETHSVGGRRVRKRELARRALLGGAFICTPVGRLVLRRV